MWAGLKYTKENIIRAGKILSRPDSSETEKDKALDVLDNWRAVHAYPLHIFQMTLKKKASKLDKNAPVPQRLKRSPAIIYKLQRVYKKKPFGNLYTMQDIGGCRAILSDLSSARKLYETYLKSDLKHTLINKKNYIDKPNDTEKIDGPKLDGYRGFHLIYAYKSNRGKHKYNGLLTEIQIRTKLQHIWASAVETAGFFTRQAIKSNDAEKIWLDFFRLVSSAFARIEGSAIVSNTPEDEKELYLQIKKIEDEIKFIEKMNSWTEIIPHLDSQIKTKRKEQVKFFLVELDLLRKKTIVTTFTEQEEDKAIKAYSELEKKYPVGKDYDIVLVGAENTNDLKKAYPSYFLDTAEFLARLNKIISKYKN